MHAMLAEPERDTRGISPREREDPSNKGSLLEIRPVRAGGKEQNTRDE